MAAILGNRCRALLIALALALVAGTVQAALPKDDIGTAAMVKDRVTGSLQSEQWLIRTGDRVYQNEVIETAAKAQGEFVLNDETKLAVGPNSRIVLDEFVYDPKTSGGSIVINATKGAFRFITGKSKKSAYTIKTPTATIGVRGTVFDGYVDEKGEIALLLVDGEIDVCGTPRKCRRLKKLGHFLHVRRNGLIRGPLKWDGSFMGGVKFGAAFPFIGRRLKIDPLRRFKRTDLLGGSLLRKAKGQLGAPGRAVGRKLQRGTQRKMRVPRIRRPRF